MNRFLAWLVLVTMVAGCRSRATPISNPFLAPDRVPPPATRMPAPGTAVPYYDNGQSVAPPVIQQGAGAPAAGSAPYTPGAQAVPPGGAIPLQAGSGWGGTPSARDVLPPSSQPVRAATANSPAERGISIPSDSGAERLAVRPAEMAASQMPQLTPTPRQSIQTLGPPVSFPNGSYPPYVPGGYPGGWQTVEITELPPAGVRRGPATLPAAAGARSAAAAGSGSRAGRWSRPNLVQQTGSPDVQLASAERAVESDQLLSSAGDATPRTRARYGIGPRYEWLKGRLERSAATGQWKLRYVPIDGSTDDFGGSVVIDNPRALGRSEPGDFVQVYGSVDARRSDDVSFAATYRVTRVERLAK